MKTSRSDALIVTLPEKATTLDRIEYNPKEAIWKFASLSAPSRFDWTRLEPYFDNRLIELAKIAAVRCLERYSIPAVHGAFEMLKRLAESNFEAKSGLMSKITEAHVRVYLSKCKKTTKWHENDVRKVQLLLVTWHNLKLPRLDSMIIPYLNKIKIKNYPAGVNVRVMNSGKGIYSDLERQGIDITITDGFANGNMTVEEHVLCCLISLFGQRPVQYATIKLKDFKSQLYDGQKRLCLNIPMAKGSGNLGTASRNEFLPTKVLPQKMEKIILAHVVQVQKEYKRLLSGNRVEQIVEPKNLPLFPAWAKKSYVPGFMYHSDSQLIHHKLKRVFDKHNLLSEETGERLNITATRFRHTLTTRYCAEGKSDWEVAAMMGWRNTASIKPYREISTQMVQKMTKDDAIALAPFYQAFKGTLKTKGADVKSGSVKSHDLNIDHGDCGMDKFCGAIIPYACYTCKFFEPWEETEVHMEFLEVLLKMREEKLEADANGIALLSKNRIATVHDFTICACAEVVKMCMEKKENKNA